MPDFGSATYRLLLDATRFRAGFYDAARVANSFSRRLSATMMRAGAMLQNWGRNLTLFVTGPLALFAKSSVQTFQEFQATMRKTAGIAEIGVNKMGKQLRGAALEKQLDKVSDKIIKMGLGFGQTAQDMAEGLYFISSAGFRAGKAMTILKQVAMSSAAGLGQTEDVALAVVGAIQAYNLKASDAARITDTLSMAVRKGVAESDALAKVLGTALGPARDAGVEFDEVAGAVALMTRSSMPAARAATSLRSILMRFQDPTEEVSNGLKKMGLNANNVRVMMAEAGKTFPFISEQAEEMAARGEKVSDRMLKGYGGLQNTLFAMKEEMGDANVRAAELFDSIRAQPGFNAMIASVDSANDVMGNTTAAMHQIGDAADQNETSFQIMTKSLDFAMKKFQALTDALKVRLGEMLEPRVRQFAEAVSGMIDGFMKLPESAQDQVLKIAGAVAALGPALMILGGLLKALTIFATPVGAVAGGAMVLAASLGVFAARSPEVVKHLKEMGRELGNTFHGVVEKAGEIWDLFVDKLELIGREAWPAVKRFLEEAGEVLTKMGEMLKPIISAFGDLVATALPVALDLLTDVLGVVKDLVSLIDGDAAAGLVKWAVLWWAVNRAVRAVYATGKLLTALPLFSGAGPIAPAAGGAAGVRAAAPMFPFGGGSSANYRNYYGAPTGSAYPVGGVPITNLPAGQRNISGAMRASNAPAGARGMVSSSYARSLRQNAFAGPSYSAFNAVGNPFTGMPESVGRRDYLRSARGMAGSAIRGFPGALRGAASGMFLQKIPGAAKAAAGNVARLGASAGRNLAAGAKNMLTPLNLAMVVGVSALTAWEKHKSFTAEMKTVIGDTVANLESGAVTLSQVASQSNQLLSGPGSRTAAKWEIVTHAMTNPIESIMNLFGVTESKYEQAITKSEKLEESIDRYQTKFNKQFAKALDIEPRIKIGDVIGKGSTQSELTSSLRNFQQYGDGVRKEFGVLFNIVRDMSGVTDEQKLQIAGLVGHYKELNGSMSGLSMATLHTYLRAGMLDEALEYLNGEMDEATKKLKNNLVKALKDMALPMKTVKDVAKEWVAIALSAQKLTKSQRVALTQTAGVLEQSGVFDGKKGDQRSAIFKSLFESGNFAKALAKAQKWLRGPDNDANAKSLVKSIDRILLPGVRNALRGSAFLGGGRTVTGKKQQPIEGMLDGFVGAKLGGKSMFFSRSARKKMTKGLLDAFGEAGVKVPDQILAEIETATKKDKWKAALHSAIKVGATTKDAETALEQFKATLSRQEVDVLVDATSGGGGGGGGGKSKQQKKHHSGGMIRGRTMSDIPATLQEGEYVVRRSAAQRFRPLLEKLNTYHEGGLVNYDLSGLGESVRRRVASATGILANRGGGSGGKGYTGGKGIVKLGRWIESMGFDVGEHSRFGGVAPVHTGTSAAHGDFSGSGPPSKHYSDNALDVNWRGGGSESAKLDMLYSKLKKISGVYQLLWRTTGHYDHLHLAMGGGSNNNTYADGTPVGGATGQGGPALRGRRGGVQLGTPGGWTVNAMVRGLSAMGAGGAVPGGNVRTPGKATALGRALAARYGWNKGPQWNALHELWTRESGWEPGRMNISSLATGIPQALPGTKIYGNAWNSMGRYKKDGKLYLKGADARKEIAWGLNYIKERYGSPASAINFHNGHNWYTNGGYARKPHAGVFGERNGHPADEVVMPLDSNITTRAMSKAFTRDTNLARSIGAAVAEHMPAGNDGADIVVQVDGYELGRVQRRRRILNGDH